MIVLKIVLIGEGGVGKTAIRERYLGEGFNSDYVMTIGADFAMKEYVVNNRDVKFQIWDLAGQERFDGVREVYYKGALGALLVYDVTRLDSYYNSPKWVNELWNNNGRGRVPVVVVANKIDLRGSSEESISSEQGKAFTEKLNEITSAEGFSCNYIETSAKTGENILDAFSLLGENIMRFAENQKRMRQKAASSPKTVINEQLIKQH